MYFQALDRNDHQIRLIRRRIHTFEFYTIIASLKYPPQYRAISYSWGGMDENPVAITINRLTWYIPVNLHFALVQVLDDDTVPDTDLLWVDALCINKADQNERSWQVAQMHDIFASAEFVYFCIGPEANDSSWLFDFLQPWGRKAADVGVYPGDKFFFNNAHKDTDTTSSTLGARSFIDELISTESVYSKRLRDAIKALARRPNWTRCWIIHELVHAKRGVVLCGNKRMHLHRFYAIMRALSRVRAWRGDAPPLGDGYEFIPDPSSNALLGIDGRLICMGGEMLYESLETTMHWYLTRLASTYNAPNFPGPFYQATDPRDVIFAFLGAASDWEHLDLSIDYRKTTRDVYTAATVAIYAACPGQLLLELASFPKDTADLPTWVPDWRRIGRLGIQEPLSEDASFQLFRVPQVVSRLTIVNGYILQRCGFACGVVRRAFRVLDSQKNDEQHALALYAALGDDRKACVDDMLEFLHLYAPDGDDGDDGDGSEETSEAPETRLWRTISADRHRQLPLVDRFNQCCERLLRCEPVMAPELSAVAIAWIQSFPEADLGEPLQAQVNAAVDAAQETMLEVTRNRTLFVTEEGRAGLGPYLAKPGDVIAALVGDTVPVLLRPIDDDQYQYLGQAFVEDMMDGQLDESEYKHKAFNLFATRRGERVLEEAELGYVLAAAFEVHNALCYMDEEGEDEQAELEALRTLHAEFARQATALGLDGDERGRCKEDHLVLLFFQKWKVRQDAQVLHHDM
ncbi:HET domain protein [Cordyceps fumosorosea ARSEF 2679]|uniref:HET domain protein n=1 Tax=Cordyceps fumosorosea (strain ARSEF 2679) TaxID=1081104 RepID=A0A168CC45_CORFA|nr:HET domain protein [Cordyceps fumosorosea ARSEF 2679]OAA71208.1 HET domain protein [Cordyceps fumosorosea ARSEF 2679]